MGTAREKSSRIKNKMLRPFGNSCLFESYLNLLEDIKSKKSPFNNIIIALNKDDKLLYRRAMESDIRIQDRNKFSATKATLPKDIYHYLTDYEEDYVMWVNACFPFLKAETVINVANFFVSHREINSLHCVKKRENWFWDKATNKPLNLEKTTDAQTQDSLPIYESVHCFHIHNKDDLMRKNRYWSFKKNDPYLYEVKESFEFLDIDSPMEFDICESVYMR